MKYAILVPDGAADEPLDELGGKTPLQAAATPNMDWIAANGRLGTVRNVPDGMAAGSDVAILSVLGYDPTEVYTGRAPLEAAALDIRVAPEEWIFRCNLVTIIDGVMEDYSAGHISTEEATAVIQAVQAALGSTERKFYRGVSYRHIMTIAADLEVETIPPHDILGQAVESHRPRGRGSEAICQTMDAARDVLADLEVNTVRRELGENLATDIWLWGEGKMPTLASFASRFGLQGATITAVDLIRGISKLIGWDILPVEGATGYLDTNFAGKGQRAVEAIDEYDLVFVHVEASDECGHNADASGKVEALEKFDAHIAGPVLERMRNEGDDWRLLVLPDHPTPCRVRTHTRQPVPFAIAGRDMEQVVARAFTEADAEAADLHIDRGCNLMEFFLTVR